MQRLQRTVIDKYELGTYITELVDEIKPLGEDRKTIFLPDIPCEKLPEAGGVMQGVFLTNIMNALEAEFGDRVWKIAEKAGYDIGRARAASMVQTMNIDLTDARSLGRIHDLENSYIGIKCEWIETGKKRAVQRIFYCPVAEVAKKNPKICSVILEAVERGTFDALGVKIKKPILTKIMPLGDPYCEVTDDLEE